MKDIRINREKNEVVMTRRVSQKADDPRTQEFRILQEVKATYPDIIVRNHTIKKNPNKECYRGLTYEYMREYISTHENAITVNTVLAELDEMILISKCHSKGFRYPTIKKWFLEKYPNIEKFGKEEKEEDNQIKLDLIA